MRSSRLLLTYRRRFLDRALDLPWLTVGIGEDHVRDVVVQQPDMDVMPGVHPDLGHVPGVLSMCSYPVSKETELPIVPASLSPFPEPASIRAVYFRPESRDNLLKVVMFLTHRASYKAHRTTPVPDETCSVGYSDRPGSAAPTVALSML